MEQNICHFIPFHKDALSIHTIHFVYETKKQIYQRLNVESVYKMYYVCSGEGFLHTSGKITPLAEGDIFFTFPSYPFAIESKSDFTYMYISFVGLRGNQIMESLNISNRNFLFHNGVAVYDFWKKGLCMNEKMMDLLSESVLLYTFAFLGDQLQQQETAPKQKLIVAQIKKYLDEHFSDRDFSVERISRELSYNKKYISYVFKKHFGIGIIEYIHTVRIQNACTMIRQGFTSINDIADRSGFEDAQYFSKIFKEKMGMTPTQYMKSTQT